MNSKSMVIGMRKFLLLVESEKCDDLPDIQIKAKALRWDLEQIFKFPEDAALTSAIHSDGDGLCVCPAGVGICGFGDPDTNICNYRRR